MDGERIENILEKSWGEFKKYYNEKVNIYINSPIYNEWKKKIIEGGKRKPAKKDEDEHWICWNEYDLMVHIGRFFYNQIAKEQDLKNIELHFDKEINPTNFGDYDFRDELKMLREKLGRTPKPDLIIAQENSPESFLLCAEAKCFHAAVEAVSRGGRTIKDEIEKDIETLRQLKQLRIAKKVVFMLFDDYYYLREKQKMEEIKSWLDKQPDVKKLYHDTRAKIKDWNELK